MTAISCRSIAAPIFRRPNELTRMNDERDWDAERATIEPHARPERIALIAESHVRLTGRALVPPGGDLWSLPAVVVAHGTEPNPVFFYANRAALELFGYPAEEFIRLPSRLSAAPVAREERARLLAEVTATGFIDES